MPFTLIRLVLPRSAEWVGRRWRTLTVFLQSGNLRMTMSAVSEGGTCSRCSEIKALRILVTTKSVRVVADMAFQVMELITCRWLCGLGAQEHLFRDLKFTNQIDRRYSINT